MKKYLLIIAIFTFLGLMYFNTGNAGAYQIGDGKTGVNINPSMPFEAGEAGVNKIFGTIFNTVIVVSAVIFVVLLLIGGITYLTSAGNEDSAGKARKMLLNAVIGLVIVLATWGVGTWIIGILQK